MGEKGGTTWDPPGFFHDANDYMVNTRPDWLPTGPAADGFGQKMRNFVDCVLYGRGNPVARRARPDGAEDDGRAVRIGRARAGSAD